MRISKKDRNGSAKTIPAKKENNLPSGARVLKEKAPVKGKDIALLALDLMWSEEGKR